MLVESLLLSLKRVKQPLNLEKYLNCWTVLILSFIWLNVETADFGEAILIFSPTAIISKTHTTLVGTGIALKARPWPKNAGWSTGSQNSCQPPIIILYSRCPTIWTRSPCAIWDHCWTCCSPRSTTPSKKFAADPQWWLQGSWPRSAALLFFFKNVDFID